MHSVHWRGLLDEGLDNICCVGMRLLRDIKRHLKERRKLNWQEYIVNI